MKWTLTNINIFYDIERLSYIGLTVNPKTLHSRLINLQDSLDNNIILLRNSWSVGGTTKFQLIGDNWNKNILPSFRTSQQKTLSIHLFNLIAVIDKIIPQPAKNVAVLDISDINIISTYLPSVEEQGKLMKELTFLFATSVIANIPQLQKAFKSVYPQHLDHKYSEFSGIKTVQVKLDITFFSIL